MVGKNGDDEEEQGKYAVEVEHIPAGEDVWVPPRGCVDEGEVLSTTRGCCDNGSLSGKSPRDNL